MGSLHPEILQQMFYSLKGMLAQYFPEQQGCKVFNACHLLHIQKNKLASRLLDCFPDKTRLAKASRTYNYKMVLAVQYLSYSREFFHSVSKVRTIHYSPESKRIFNIPKFFVPTFFAMTVQR